MLLEGSMNNKGSMTRFQVPTIRGGEIIQTLPMGIDNRTSSLKQTIKLQNQVCL